MFLLADDYLQIGVLRAGSEIIVYATLPSFCYDRMTMAFRGECIAVKRNRWLFLLGALGVTAPNKGRRLDKRIHHQIVERLETPKNRVIP